MKGFIKSFALISCLVFSLFNGDCMSMDARKNSEDRSDINNNRSNYLCEKSARWIKDNRELVDTAKYNESKFEELINRLEQDNVLEENSEYIDVYDDIRRNCWHDEHRFGINYKSSGFFGGIFERQMYDF